MLLEVKLQSVLEYLVRNRDPVEGVSVELVFICSMLGNRRLSGNSCGGIKLSKTGGSIGLLFLLMILFILSDDILVVSIKIS